MRTGRLLGACALAAAVSGCITSDAQLMPLSSNAYPPTYLEMANNNTSRNLESAATRYFSAQSYWKRLYVEVGLPAQADRRYSRNGAGRLMPITVVIRNENKFTKTRHQLIDMPRDIRDLAASDEFSYQGNRQFMQRFATYVLSKTYCKGGAVKLDKRPLPQDRSRGIRLFEKENLRKDQLADWQYRHQMNYKASSPVVYGFKTYDAWEVRLTCSLWRERA